jgi:aminopeptidase N
MEYPMGTLITGARNLQSLVGVTVHELYHSWYQNVLATNEALYAWMDEGFTSFASSETMQYLFEGSDNPHAGSMRGYQRLVESGKEEPMATHADHYHTNFAYGRASYSKGAVYLNQIRYIIGEEAFRSGMLRYHLEWKLKHPTDLDFLRLMEKESGMILDWFHEYFVHTTKTIDYAITSVDAAENETESTNIELKRVGLMPMPLDVWVEYMDGTKEEFYIPMRIMRGEKPTEHDLKRTILEDWPWVEPSYSFTIPMPMENIRSVSIDPTERLADVNTTNNVQVLSSEQ